MKSLLETYRAHGLHYGSFRAFLEAEYPHIPLGVSFSPLKPRQGVKS